MEIEKIIKKLIEIYSEQENINVIFEIEMK